MYLHEDLEVFKDVISATSENQGDKDFAIIEKDYFPEDLFYNTNNALIKTVL